MEQENVVKVPSAEESVGKKSKLKRNLIDEKDVPSKKRRSEERRDNAKFIGICMSCYQYANSTTGEVSSFVYEHMCNTINVDGIKECIALLQSRLASLCQPVVSSKQIEVSTSSAPPPPPPAPEKGQALSKQKNAGFTAPAPPPPPLPPPPFLFTPSKKFDGNVLIRWVGILLYFNYICSLKLASIISCRNARTTRTVGQKQGPKDLLKELQAVFDKK